jgi:carnitine O-acetyltransferase
MILHKCTPQALFGACRVPELSNKDTVAVNPESSHVVVLENNQMYFFQALWPDGTVAANEEDILEILLAIKADASKVAPEISSRNAIGVLTTLPRREWAVARDAIISCSQDNGTALEIVDGALFVLVIDDVVPKDIHEAAANMLHGTYNLKSENNLIDYQVRIAISGKGKMDHRSRAIELTPRDPFDSTSGWIMLQSMV